MCLLLLFALFSFSSLGHGGKNGISRQIELRLRQVRTFWNAQDQPLQIYEAVPGVTSYIASTIFADLKAAQSVDKTNKLYIKLRTNILQYVRLVHLLEVTGPRNSIAILHDNDKSRFC